MQRSDAAIQSLPEADLTQRATPPNRLQLETFGIILQLAVANLSQNILLSQDLSLRGGGGGHKSIKVNCSLSTSKCNCRKLSSFHNKISTEKSVIITY